jgi:hypothetical protein
MKDALATVEAPGGEELTFAQACEELGVSSTELAGLREGGLVACIRRGTRQFYPREPLILTRHLLNLGRSRGWEVATLCWFADLMFAGQVGRTLLLPSTSREPIASPRPPRNWLETSQAAGVLRDLRQQSEDAVEGFVATLRSLAAVALGPGQHWPDVEALQRSALYPIITYFEGQGVPILGQASVIARDAPQAFMALVLAFTGIAPPTSVELGQLVRNTFAKLKGRPAFETAVPVEEQIVIDREALVAVDKFYVGTSNEIHTTPDAWEISLGVIRAQKRTIALQMQLPDDYPQHAIDNIIDLIRPYLGTYGARVVHLLYEVANDPPYWRTPLISIDTNDLLDRLGDKRDRRGVHYSKNRKRLRDVLNAAHELEIHGEILVSEGGREVRRAIRRSVLSLIGADFDADEHRGLTTEELFRRGLPKVMQIRLNFYEGVRRPDGRLGNQYVLMPRLASPKALPAANYAATHELLRAFLLFLYRETSPETRTLAFTRQLALDKANITNKNKSMATQTLRKALDRLVADGTLESFSPALPLGPEEELQVTLSSAAAQGLLAGVADD